MKSMKKLLALLLSLLLLGAASAMAAGEYTYTVRIYAGGQGLINGEEVVVYEGLHSGDRVTFNLRSVTLADGSKYYVKGIRESGKDNNTVGVTSFLVTRDRDYVVAYGILGDAVAYTINYVDREGRQLAPSETYYGNVGDKPVIAYLYIDGYEPLYYNLTKTLSDNAAENVFDFVYTAVVRPTAPQGGVIGPTGGDTEPAGEGTPSGQNGETTPGGESGQGGETTPGETGQGGETAGGETGQSGETASGESGQSEHSGQSGQNSQGNPGERTDEGETQSPVELRDLDAPEPGAEGEGSAEADEGERVLGLPLGAVIGGGAALIVVLGGALGLTLAQRKRKKQ